MLLLLLTRMPLVELPRLRDTDARATPMGDPRETGAEPIAIPARPILRLYALLAYVRGILVKSIAN